LSIFYDKKEDRSIVRSSPIIAGRWVKNIIYDNLVVVIRKKTGYYP